MISDCALHQLRVLFTVQPGLGHLHALVPLAAELRARGHGVTFASSAPFAPRVESLGFPFISYGPAWLETPTDPHFLERTSFPAFLRSADAAIVDELAARIAHSPPELIVREYTEFAGWPLARRLGIPLVTHGIMHRLPTPRMAMICGSDFSEVASRNGLKADNPILDSLGSAYLDICPPLFQPPIDVLAITRPLRLEVHDHIGLATPSWLDDLGVNRPLVYASLGTVFNATPGVLEAIIAAVADQPYDVLLTTGSDRDPATLGPLPTNVRAERYVPQSMVLPQCRAAITHGGFNTCLAAFTHGVPLYVLPIDADQPVNAAACTAAGAGINAAAHLPSLDPRGPMVNPADLDVGAMRDGVARLLADPGFRESATRIGQEIAAMPTPRVVAHDLEGLVADAIA